LLGVLGSSPRRALVAPEQLELELVVRAVTFMLDIEARAGRNAQALSCHLNDERVLSLQSIRQPAELLHELAAAVRLFEIAGLLLHREMIPPQVPVRGAGSPLAALSFAMREPRHRFTDDVRSTTRAIALRMVHAGTVADSPEALDAWIARTDDLRERLEKGGYGTAFDARELFPLFQAHVAKANRTAPPPSRAGRGRWLWIAIVIAAVIVAILAAMMGG
jgi:hypothetical protein